MLCVEAISNSCGRLQTLISYLVVGLRSMYYTFIFFYTQRVVSFSYLEIYNERVGDLLRPSKNKDKFNLKVREHPKEGPYVQGTSTERLSSYSIHSLFQVFGHCHCHRHCLHHHQHCPPHPHHHRCRCRHCHCQLNHHHLHHLAVVISISGSIIVLTAILIITIPIIPICVVVVVITIVIISICIAMVTL